ncbi:hypothetical protein EI94DRAFT_1803563 [Lactarius quietus]|nr:hypothetical protein EI94DRAFT_1803563 [Lactarius quietus]
MTTYLPFEILTAIFEQVDDPPDLRHIRAASRTFCAIATPIAFRVLSVTSTARSAQNLRRLFDVPEIVAHVKEVAYRDVCTVHSRELEFNQELRGVRTSAMPKLTNAFSRIHQLPLLETIKLTFFPVGRYLRDYDIDGCLALQVSILGALSYSFSVRAPLNLTSLSLHILRTWNVTPLDTPPFQSVLKTLRRLELTVRYDGGMDDCWIPFWGTLCHRMVLSPTQHALTELTLQSEIPVGVSLGLSFAGLYFPRLSSLSLGNIVFEPSVGVESFILRHAATLMRLELMACTLPIGDNNPTYWEHIWDRFAAVLTALVALRVNENGDNGPEDRYVEGFSPTIAYIRSGYTKHPTMLTMRRFDGSARPLLLDRRGNAAHPEEQWKAPDVTVGNGWVQRVRPASCARCALSVP